jgi:hypothetical protein
VPTGGALTSCADERGGSPSEGRTVGGRQGASVGWPKSGYVQGSRNAVFFFAQCLDRSSWRCVEILIGPP